jgi:hypothetical protein
MNKFHTVLLGGIMALSLAGCKSMGSDASSTSGSSMGSGTTSSPSGQSGTNTGTTNDVNSGTSPTPATQTPPVTNSSNSGPGR